MPLRFVPKRSTQHRIAAIALMRTLYRQAQQIQLPKHLHLSLTHDEHTARQSARKDSELAVPDDERNPITKLIKRQFKRNRHDTSPRLIYAALSSGYKFVNLLHKAITPNSSEHSSVISYLISHPPNPPKPPTPEPHKPNPLLIRIPSKIPGGLPTYIPASRPLPASALTGKRGIPRLSATTNGFPFLRLGKPQPQSLSRILRHKIALFEDRAQYKEAVDEVMDDAIEEDMWDDVVAGLCRLEHRLEPEGYRGDSTFVSTLREGQEFVKQELEFDRKDNINRAQALMKIMLEEEDLAKQEALRKNPRLPPKLLGL